MKLFIVLAYFVYQTEFAKFANAAYCCKGIVYNGRICYWLTIVEGTAEEVNSECEKNFGNLASLPSQEVVNFLHSDYHSVLSEKQTAFIGVNDRIKHGIYTEWNGESLSWTNWKGGEPKDRIKSRCAVVNFMQRSQRYEWVTDSCSDAMHHGLCSKIIEPDDLGPCKGVCLSDSCYWLTDSVGGTSFLNSICEQDEGILATIPSLKLNNELELYYGHVLSKHNEIYIGSKRAENGEWTTWDSEKLTWTQWKDGLSLDDESKKCTRILPFESPVYAWENQPCEESSYRGLCYRRNRTLSVNQTEASNSTSENWTSQSDTTSSAKLTRTTPLEVHSFSFDISTLNTSPSRSTSTTPFKEQDLRTSTPKVIPSGSTTTPDLEESFNTPTINVTTSSVVCRCGLKYAIVNTSISSTAQDISTNLTLDRKLLSLYRRKLISAKDDRPSARTVGFVGVTVIILEISFVLLLDLPFYISLFSKFLK